MKHLIQIAMIMFLHMICFPNPTYSFWRFRSALQLRMTAPVSASTLLPLELVDKAIGSRIHIIMKNDKERGALPCGRPIKPPSFLCINVRLCKAYRVLRSLLKIADIFHISSLFLQVLLFYSVNFQMLQHILPLN